MQSSNESSVTASPFLRLPVELRRAIYSSILPYTSTFDERLQRGNGDPSRAEYNLTLIRQPTEVWKMQKTSDREVGNSIVWHRGHTALLATCHQIHDECASIIYGQNTFVIDVTFDKILFRQRWRTASNLTPCRAWPFMDHFSQRNLMRIRHYVVNVEHVDDYTGMIKYNCGGRGLTVGIRERVKELVDLLSVVDYIVEIHVHLIDGAISRIKFPSGRVHRVQDETNYTKSQSTLDPLHRLYGVRKAKITGVSASYAACLEKSMSSTRAGATV